MKIKKIWGREVLDSRGFPTIECNLLLDNNRIVKSSVPSGASVGIHEALELRDKDEKRYFGKGVLKAIENIDKKIAPTLIGKNPDLLAMDKIIIDLDGTENKSNLGANATLAVSMVIARAQAMVENLQIFEFIGKIFEIKKYLLPKVMFNVLNGGVHSDSGISFQEFMIMPISGKTFSENLQIAVIVFQNLKKLLLEKNFSVGVGDEGGFAPKLEKNGEKKALDFLIKAAEKSGFIAGKDVVFCLDVAASEFYDEKEKKYFIENKKNSSQDLINIYNNLLNSYPIFSIEDGLAEDDWEGWRLMTESFGSKVQLVGDDIFVTNPNRIKKGIESKVANAVLIKLNQIGTVTQTLDAIKLCQQNNYKTIISHRSGETCDTFIADLAVGTSAGQFKAGGCCRGERIVKFNRLLEIEENFIKIKKL